MYPTHSQSTAVNRRSGERAAGGTRRRGVVAIKVAILSVVLISFVALGVDVGLMYNARQELQRATDAAAMAAAVALAHSRLEDVDPRQTAVECAAKNQVAGDMLTLRLFEDVELGQAAKPSEGAPYEFTPNTTPINAVRVTGRRTKGSDDGPIPLYFAGIFGSSMVEATCRATAVMRPRDMAMVVDLSDSHNNDSELRNYKYTDVNLHEVWANTFARGDWPDWDKNDPQAAGWSWGVFKLPGRGFGYDDSKGHLPTIRIDPNPNLYMPGFDTGLVHLEYSGSAPIDWNPDTSDDYRDLEKFLQTMDPPYQGDFSAPASEIWAVLHDTTSKGNWKLRAAVATGFADWNSGIDDPEAWWKKKEARGEDPGPKGDGDMVVDANELVWGRATLGIRTPKKMKGLWSGYMNYVSETSATRSRMLEGNPDFQWKVGIKTFMSFLLDKKPRNVDTPEFVPSRAQPMYSVKQAVEVLVKAMSAADKDQLSLDVFGTKAYHEVDLSGDLQAVSSRLREMQAGHYDGFTNIAGGLRLGRHSLTQSPEERPSATKVIILLSDGTPTAYEQVDPSGNIKSKRGKASDAHFVKEARDRALEQAGLARDAGIKIYAVGVGSSVDSDAEDFMRDLANITDGRYFSATGMINDGNWSSKRLLSELVSAFETIAVLRPVALIE